ncbi:hypothetical protein BSR29_06375 [Boudabousia liubingyangii]|uniref:DUF2550 family protein n=1 Tax=Boudabousia liubingyangii TaxID=1921764 RepID=A0A1Q5PKT3_9ACTO|nr:DUF2550 family protein [Boudabousia liubingyangii]OKL46437.1 hypothetical protein BSR28_07905 [Boudabousia liubingyangii]OKL47240.1 hypothetical protein BSR29_06375 [Boudabousia liubingyangii]
MPAALWFSLGFLIALLLLALILLGVLGMYRIRMILHRVGSFELAIKKSPEDSWTSGMGLFNTHELQWHRTVSLSLKPGVELRRSTLTFSDPHRRPGSDVVEVEARDGQSTIYMSLREASFHAMISWADSAPPEEAEIF